LIDPLIFVAQVCFGLLLPGSGGCQLAGEEAESRLNSLPPASLISIQKFIGSHHRTGGGRVVTYLQKEIRAERRNIGALKLSKLPQLDHFEENLNLSRVRLKPPAPRPNPTVQPAPDPEIDDQQRDNIVDELTTFRQGLRPNGSVS
jgi:hypothetical protein